MVLRFDLHGTPAWIKYPTLPLPILNKYIFETSNSVMD